jgi:tripartite-type tricarboxylate transporter receptor subunit TctC
MTDSRHRRCLRSLCAAVLLAGLAPALLPQTTQAQQGQGGYPNRPIRAVVPSPAGGPPDLTLRILTPKLTALLGQPVVVENRGGAGGIVGTGYVARQPADGYTWLFTTASHANTPPFNENVPFNPIRDFTHVTLAVQNFGQALVVPVSLKVNSVAELIELAKKSPGKLTYANAGFGTASHIPAEVFKSMTGTDLLSVMYKGIGEATNDLLAGRIDAFFVGTQIAAQHVASGKLRALAVTGARRWKGMPEVPTLQEQGLTGYNVVNWFGVWLPAGAPTDLVERIHQTFVQVIKDPEVIAQFDKLGLEGIAMPPADFARFVESEAKSAQAIADRLKAAGGKP